MTSDPVSRFLARQMAQSGRRARLRVLTGSETVDRAINIYQSLGWSLLGATVVPSVFCLAALMFMVDYALPMMGVTQNRQNLTGQLGEAAIAASLMLLVATPLLLIGASYSGAVATRLVSDLLLGNLPDSDLALQGARRALPSVIRVNLRTTLLSVTGLVASLLLFMVSAVIAANTGESDATAGIVLAVAYVGALVGVGVFLGIRSVYALAVPVTILEGKKAGEACRRSRELLKGTQYQPSGSSSVWSVYFICGVVFLAVLYGIQGCFSAVGLNSVVDAWLIGNPLRPVVLAAIALLPTFLAIWTVVPFWAASIVLIYYERRIRLEGYDIEALAEEVWRADRASRFEL